MDCQDDTVASGVRAAMPSAGRAGPRVRWWYAGQAALKENIAVERMRFNQAAQAFDTRRDSFPTVAVAGFFGTRFRERAYFQAQAGASQAPAVTF